MALRRISQATKRKINPIAALSASRDGKGSRAGRALVIITGMSGSGKDTVLNTFEDLGFYCVDNLPVDLIPRFAELARDSRDIDRTAIVVDVREGQRLEKLPGLLRSVRKLIPTTVIYLEAS